MGLKIKDIKVRNRLRSIDQTSVGQLAESIDQIGLLQPIIINNDFELVSQNKKTVMTFETGYEVFSDKLTWSEQNRQIHTPDAVVIKGDGLVITGTGLIGDVEKNEFRILNKVRAEVLSP